MRGSLLRAEAAFPKIVRSDGFSSSRERAVKIAACCFVMVLPVATVAISSSSFLIRRFGWTPENVATMQGYGIIALGPSLYMVGSAVYGIVSYRRLARDIPICKIRGEEELAAFRPKGFDPSKRMSDHHLTNMPSNLSYWFSKMRYENPYPFRPNEYTFVTNANLCRELIAELLLHTQSEQYSDTQDTLDFVAADLIEGAKALELRATEFTRTLRQERYAFDQYSLEEFFHPKKVCDMAKLVDSDPDKALELWQEFRDTPEGYYYVGVREPTAFVQKLECLSGQRVRKSART